VETARILVVDDSRVVRAVLASALRGGGYEVEEASGGAEALHLLARGNHEAVITDLRMPGLDGFQVLEEVKRLDPDVEVIVLTGTHGGDVGCAVRALRMGAHDYLSKPPSSAEEILLTVGRAVEKKRLKDANRRLITELQHMSRRDPLTSLLNRHALAEALPREIARARRHRRPLSLALFDLDHFKAINDTHGHPGGDVVLCAFAESARSLVRAEDSLYRYGGEEFLALLPETDVRGARRMAERVLAVVGARPVGHQGRRIPVTASAGVAALDAAGDGDSLIARADAALYRAKREGRNRVATGQAGLALLRRA
jgi:diguanylate cyclase (GGDEF)-like protein